MKTFRVRDQDGKIVLEYRHTEQLVFTQWPGSTQEEIIEPDPEAPIPYSGSWRITKFAFRSRFTQEEKVKIDIAGLDKPNGNMAERAQSAALRVYHEDIRVAEYVDLKRSDVMIGVQTLEAAGLLAAGRANEILNTVPQQEELFE